MELAAEVRPDLILLDHQLPGTTGFEVCQSLIADESLATIPVVVSSTLRKKAYVEYADLDNVVDMLPKPYTEDLLITTVANAIETAAMVVASQSKGSAVPEIIGETSEPDLAGSFVSMNLREVIDFLNNGHKNGVLEIEADRLRFVAYVNEGRIQGMSATGLSGSEVDNIASQLPESLANLAEVLKLTIAGRGSAEFDGFMQLLDRRVLDPRLTSKLMRFQAAMLMGRAFDSELTRFEFRANQKFPSLHQDLPLQVSLLALLVENAMYCDESLLPTDDPAHVYSRRAIRGQNLDRSGLSARHMKILNLLANPCSIDDLQPRLVWPRDEVRRVLHALVQVGLLERKTVTATGKFVVFEPSTLVAGKLRTELNAQTDKFIGKVVRDTMTLQLMVKRMQPDAVFFAIDAPEACEAINEAMAESDQFSEIPKFVLVPQVAFDDDAIDWAALLGFMPSKIASSPYSCEMLFAAMESLDSDDEETSQSESDDDSVAITPVVAPVSEATSQEVVS